MSGARAKSDAPFASLAEKLRAQLRPPHSAAPSQGEDGFAWFEFLRAQAAGVGVRARSGADDVFGFDPEFLRRATPLLQWLHDNWWRVECSGAQHLPPPGPALFIGAPAGASPWAALMAAHVISRAAEKPGAAEIPQPRFLAAGELSALPFAQPLLARLGGLRAGRENAAQLLRAGHALLAFPQQGAGFTLANALQLARARRAPLIPFALSGAAAETAGAEFGAPPPPARWRLRFGETFAPGKAAELRTELRRLQ